ncbi:MAG: ion transporter [Lachnospiraceae bacterium]|nr:ion transporter [Lachnospiraceae bacterium]
MTKFRKRLFEIVQIGAAKDLISRSFDVIISVIIIVNIIVTFLSTFNQFNSIKSVLNWIETATVIFFTAEYIARIFTADFLYPDKKKAKAVLAFLFSFYGIIDFLSFFPLYLPFFTPTGVAVFRLFRVFRIFRLFKINAQFDAFNVIVRVLNEKKMQLLSSVVLILMLMLSASMLMYGVEHDAQPEVFENALSGFWWSMATVFTIGYGDIYPVTLLGKLLALIISFLGVGIIAIPTGIISAGFVEEFQKINMYKGHGEGHELEFVTGVIGEDHDWNGKAIKDIVVPPQSLIAMVLREGNNLSPSGNLVLKANDTVVLTAKNYRDEDIHLNEIPMAEGDKWLGLEVKDLDLPLDEKIVMIKRGSKTIIPSGNTVIRKGDALVMYYVE